MTERRHRARSDFYQQYFCELSVDPTNLDAFSSQDDLYKQLNPFGYSEEVLILKDKLNKELWRLMKDNLSDKHFKVMTLLAEGKTQTEVGKAIGENQSNISKWIYGNGQAVKDKRGIAEKMQTIMLADKKIQSLLAQLVELRDE